MFGYNDWEYTSPEETQRRSCLMAAWIRGDITRKELLRELRGR